MSPARKAGSDVVVVGGGAVGCATARALLRKGAGVTLVERNEPGSGATGAAAGMLSPLGEAGGDAGPFLTLARASLARYPDFVRELEAETGEDLRFELTGRLHLARTEAERRRLEERHRWLSRHRLDGRWVEGPELRTLDPGLEGEVRGGLLLEEDGQVDNRRLARALGRACRDGGARMLVGREVRELVRQGRRICGVRLDDGGELGADAVVVAAGCWSGALGGLPGPLPVRPVRGQMAALGPADRGRLPRWTLVTPECYLVPRPDGRLLVGATEEEAGFRALTTAEGVAGLLRGALRAWPGAGELPLLEAWAGLRPGTPDDLPVLGEDPDGSGLFWATGHYRNGILLAPVTADVLAALVTGDDPPVDPAPFGAGRFRA